MIKPNSADQLEPDDDGFFMLFAQHWRAGTGMSAHNKGRTDKREGWSFRFFADAMEWAGTGGIDPATVQAWLTGEHWPQRNRKDAILKVFFREPGHAAGSPVIGAQRATMENAWQVGQALRNRKRLRQKDEPELGTTWIGGAPMETPGVVALRLDQPQQNNESTETWYLRAELWLDAGEYETDDGKQFYLALRRAFVTITAAGYRIVNRTLIGDTARPHPNFRARSNGTDIVGPVAQEIGCLVGDPLGDDFIAQVCRADDGSRQRALTISVYAFGSSFAFAGPSMQFNSAEADVAVLEKERILNILVAKGRRDDQGRVLVARDTMNQRTIE